jgi:hypothetical protein
VEPRQAGEVIKCTCGASLEAPTMLEMASLERAEPEPGPRRPPRPWGVRKSLSLLGAVVFLAALAPAVYLLTDQPPPFERERVKMRPDAIRRQTKTLTPLAGWRLWHSFRDKGPDGRSPIEEQIHEEMLRWHRERVLRWWLKLGLVASIGVAGLGLAVVPLWKK